VRTMVRRGDIQAMRIGRRILISKVALGEWVEKNANTTFAGTRARASSPSRVRRSELVARSVTITEAAAEIGCSATFLYEHP
jgi:Helix-turn-helix domain